VPQVPGAHYSGADDTGRVSGNVRRAVVAEHGLGFDFNNFMMVGMLVQGLFMMVGNGVSNLVEDCENDFTQEILVRPVSRYSLILGKIAGSSFASYLCFFFIIIVGYAIGAMLMLHQFLKLLDFSTLSCVLRQVPSASFIATRRGKTPPLAAFQTM